MEMEWRFFPCLEDLDRDTAIRGMEKHCAVFQISFCDRLERSLFGVDAQMGRQC